MVDAYGDPGAVVGQVIGSIRNGFAVGLLGEIIGGHLDRFAPWMPFMASLSESIISLALLVADSIAVIRAACSAATDSSNA